MISNGVTSPASKKVSAKIEEDKDSSLSSTKTKTSKTGDVNEDDEIEYIEKNLPRKSSNVNQFDESADNFVNEQQTAGKGFKLGNSSVVAALAQVAASSIPLPSVKLNSKQLNSTKENGSINNSSSNSSVTHSSSSSSSKKGKNIYKELQPSPTPVSYTNNKDEVIQR